MDCFEIVGGRALAGRVRPSASKNASLPILASVLLLEGGAEFHRPPRLRDVHTLLELLEALGCECHWAGDALRMSAPGEGPTEAPYGIVRRMRASVCVLGPLLARRGRARVALPGGCVLGDRPIDLHLKGLTALGAEVRLEHGTVVAEAPREGLRGARVRLAGPRGSTVLGTANVMMAATLARGGSVLEEAAREPEIVALASFLNACGARILGAGSTEIRVEGVSSLCGRSWELPPDRIEAGTLLLAGAITGGSVRVEGCRPLELEALLGRLRASGLEPRRGPDWVEVPAWEEPPRATGIQTAPYPGFPTDLQAQWMAYTAVCAGEAWIREGVYPQRFVHAAELKRLGAVVEAEEGLARVRGPSRLEGAEVLASDLRASAALVLAGLAARGRTVVHRVYHLDRGYEGLEGKLSGLGGRVLRRVDGQAP